MKKVSSGYAKLDEWVAIWRETLPKYFGYPFNEVSPLRDFYEWYYAAGINLMNLNNAGYPSWVNEYSNTVFMRCPSPELAHKYQLAQNEDPRFGGKLAHVVVMQHFTEEAIDAFVAEVV